MEQELFGIKIESQSSDESRLRAGSLYKQDWLITKESSLNFGQSYIYTEKPPQNVVDIIEAVKKEMVDIVERIQEWENNNKADLTDLHVEQARNRLKNLIFFLYGIAEEAKKVGDNVTVKLVQNSVGEFMSEDEYQSVINRRVSESGTFKLTRKELMGEE